MVAERDQPAILVESRLEVVPAGRAEEVALDVLGAVQISWIGLPGMDLAMAAAWTM